MSIQQLIIGCAYRAKILFGLLALCFAGCLSTEPPPQPDSPRIQKGVQEKLELALEERRASCQTKITERAMRIVDSLVLIELQLRRLDSLDLPQPMNRPQVPIARKPAESGPPLPLWSHQDSFPADSFQRQKYSRTNDSL